MSSSSSGRVRLHPADSIIDCPPRATSMNLPVAVHMRLDELTERARQMRTSRNEMLAALVADAELKSEELEDLILRYRRMTIGDVLPHDDTPVADDVVVQLRKPGRPRSAG